VTAAMPIELAATAFTTLFVAFGPVETAAVFGGLTAGVHRPERLRLAWQAVLIGGVVLLAFALCGEALLAALHISLDAFRVAGGILLLMQAVELIFAHPSGLSGLTRIEQREAMAPGDIAVFPLAFPLIAGPATLTAIVLLMVRTDGDLAGAAVVIGAMLACLLITYLCMVFTEVLHRLLKRTGANVIARLAGVLLAALAVQFIFDGIRGADLLGAA
jgi:multiple antibiotic resistance protein